MPKRKTLQSDRSDSTYQPGDELIVGGYVVKVLSVRGGKARIGVSRLPQVVGERRGSEIYSARAASEAGCSGP